MLCCMWPTLRIDCGLTNTHYQRRMVMPQMQRPLIRHKRALAPRIGDAKQFVGGGCAGVTRGSPGWRLGRGWFNDDDDLARGTSLLDEPHRGCRVGEWAGPVDHGVMWPDSMRSPTSWRAWVVTLAVKDFRVWPASGLRATALMMLPTGPSQRPPSP